MKRILVSLLFLWSTSSFAQQIPKDSLSKHVYYLASEELEGRGLGTQGKEKASIYIREQFKQAGLKPFFDTYEQPFDFPSKLARIYAKNIVGLLVGSDPILKSEYIVIGAHYDHLGFNKDKSKYYPGADDNASGVSAILELAKYFGNMQEKPKRSLIFIAFDAEESGLLGSQYFVDQLQQEQRQQIKGMFSFDMVGMLKANKGLGLKGIKSLEKGAAIAEELSQGLTLLSINAKTENRTDTEPFGSIGIPAIHMFTGLKSPYHKPEDKAELLDYDGMKEVSEFSARFISRIANLSEPLKAIPSMQSLQDKPKGKGNPLSFAALAELNFGNHNYKDEFYDAKSEVGFSLGGQMKYQLTRFLALNVEAMYNNNSSSSVKGRFERHSLLIPMNLQLGKDLFLFAGPYYKFHFQGKDAGEVLDFSNTFRKQEWGAQYGVGLELMGYQVALTYRDAFQSIYQSSPRVFAKEVGVRLGYRF